MLGMLKRHHRVDDGFSQVDSLDHWPLARIPATAKPLNAAFDFKADRVE